MSWDKENAETERTVNGGSETFFEKQSFLDMYGFANGKYFTDVLMALVFMRT